MQSIPKINEKVRLLVYVISNKIIIHFTLKEIYLIGFLFLVVILSGFGFSFSDNTSINIDNDFYKKSDIISIWGMAPDASQNLVFISIKDSDGEIIWTEKVLVEEEGTFSTLVIAGMNSWSKSGTYEIALESGEVIDSVTFFYDSGQQVNPPSAVEEFYITQEDLILTFTICIVSVSGIFVYLARNIILRKKTKYDELDLDSKKNRDYEKYHSDWTEEKIFGERKESTIDQREFNEMLKNKTLPNYYETLGLSQSSTSTQIKDKFRLLAKEWHPDKRKDGSEEKMAEINQAYEVLSNQQLRKEYDKYFSLL